MKNYPNRTNEVDDMEVDPYRDRYFGEILK